MMQILLGVSLDPEPGTLPAPVQQRDLDGAGWVITWAPFSSPFAGGWLFEERWASS